VNQVQNWFSNQQMESEMELNGKKVDVASLSVEGVDPRDYPDFCDAYLIGGTYMDGTPLTDNEMDDLTDKYGDVVNEMAFNSLY
jgi:hypothetical protein